MDHASRPTQGTDAAEDEPPGRVEPEGTQDLPRVPDALPPGQDRTSHIVAERHRREIEIGEVDELSPEFGPERLGVGVGGHDDRLGAHRAAAGPNPPGLALVPGAGDRARGEDPGARGNGGVGEAARIGERLDRAGPKIEQRAPIGSSPHHTGGFGRVEKADGRASRLPLPGALGDFGHALRADRAVKRADALDLARDRVPRHEVEDRRRRMAEKVEQPRPIGLAQDLRQGIRHDPHPGIDESDIAPRAAEADLDALEHHDLGAAFRQMQGRRQAREATADDHDIGRDVPVERRRGGRGRCRAFPKAMAARVAPHGSAIVRPASKNRLPVVIALITHGA